MLRINKTITSLILLLCFIATQNTLISMALPGQDIKIVVKESEKHSYINKYKKEVEECTGDTIYLSSTKDKIYNLTIRIDKNGKSYSEEIISVGNNKTPNFDKTSSFAINLLKKIYGATVASDFQNSKLSTSVKPSMMPDKTIKIYKGNKYLYVNIGSGIVLHPIANLKHVIDYYKNSFGEDC